LSANARAALALVAAAAMLATSCLGPADFHCDAHAQCGPSPNAFCEIDGRCSLRDVACPSGRRYRDHEGDASGTCVGATCAVNPVHAMAAGSSHACLLRADKIVSCWGRNDDGELGDGTTTPHSRPTPVTGLGKAKAIATGESHSCAVLEDGAVACWGANDAGQLGVGAGSASRVPVTVPDVSDAIAVAAGAAFSCAVLGDGTVRCWGDNSMGQLGDGGDATAGRRATAVFALTGVRTLSAHWQHACATRDDETLWCWGDNSMGQLGDGTFDVRGQPVRAVGLGAVTDVATGRAHTCAATRADGLFCWGNNNVGQLGRDAPGPVAMPTLVPIVTNPIAVAAGAQHTCAIRQGGATLCWGGNTSGQLGDGSLSTVPIPVPVVGLGPMAAIVAGGAFSCGRAADGATFCWGDDRYGELGLGSTTLRTRPARVAGVEGATELAAGAAHTCVVARDGAAGSNAGATTGHVSCWGANQAGQLGDATMNDRARAASIKGEIVATHLAAGLAHTCAVTGEGALWCWGRAGSGQLGPARNVDTPQPTPVGLAAGALVSGAAAGDAFTCATLADHTALCFGANGDGQLGVGTTKDRPMPAAVLAGAGTAALGAVDALVAGAGHACARLTDGGLRCWGRGADGQLGDGATKSAALPVTPTLGTGAAMTLAAGAAHTCALDDGGGVWCWGRGAEGQLGVGQLDAGLADAPTPVAVTGITGARGLAAGHAHTCALASDRTVLCWGANAFGELGDGSTTDRATPAPVVGLTEVEQLAAGDAHTCARRTDGSTWCWGADVSGQLGDDAVLTHNTPQLARLACP
jgi:alpha-tubulin suppressor-like RCC1 family protein